MVLTEDQNLERDKHLAWCKERALEYVKMGELNAAVSSMLSDLGKHPLTTELTDLYTLVTLELLERNSDGVRKWIEGFN